MLQWFKVDFLIFPLLTLLFSLTFTRILIWLLPVLGYVDKPDARRIHKKIMPRGGGIAIFLATLCGILFFYWLYPSPELKLQIFHFFTPASILLVTGLIDDRIGMNRFLKLILHVAAAVLVWYFGVRFDSIFGWTMPPFLSAAVTVFWILAFINGFNLIDGMDGAAAGLAVISSLCMASWMMLQNTVSPLTVFLLVLTGASLGFLRYNFSPARIFMGDTGSMFLGYFFAYCALTNIGKTATLSSLLVPMLAVAVPLFDVILAFWRRLVRKLLHKPGSGIMSADLQHLHHRLLKEDRKEEGKQRRVAFRLYFIAFFFVFLGTILLLTHKSVPTLGFLLVLFLALMLVRKLAGIELYTSTLLLQKGFSLPRKPLIAMAVTPLLDLALLYGSLLSAIWYLGLPPIGKLPVFMLVLPILIITAIFGGYNIFWFRSGAEEIRKYFKILIFGLLVTALVFWQTKHGFSGLEERAFIAIYLSVSAIALMTCRIFFIYMGTRLLWQLKQDAGLKTRQRIVVVGGGKNANIYIGDRLSHPSGIQLIGIIDDDPALTGMRVYGLNILGTLDHLDKVYRKKPFDRLVLTTVKIRKDRLAKLVRFAEEHNLKLTRFVQQERELEHASDAFDEETLAVF